MVVDDARFTCEMLRRTMRSEGFHDVRVATTASEALENLADRRADIVLADWLMPGMDGLELTQRIRTYDNENSHYTYVILLTAREGMDSLTEAFYQGVDDFIGKSPDHKELVARLSAASRIASLRNDNLQANNRLSDLNRQLREQEGMDVTTGLGTRSYVEDRLTALIRHVEGREGMGLFGIVGMPELGSLRERYGNAPVDEVITEIGARLQNTIRPLDIVGRLADNQFALVMLQRQAEIPHPNVFRRIYNALNLRAFKTSEGFVTAPTAIAITGFAPPWENAPTPQQLIETTEGQLTGAREADQIIVRRWQESR